MTMLYDTTEGLKAVFRSAQTNESMRLDLAQLERIAGGDLEEVHGEEFPPEEIRRGMRALGGEPGV